MNLNNFFDMIGFSRHQITYREELISTVGGFFGIFGIFITSYLFLDPDIAVLIVPSMGASAVLLFAAPHAPLSQPWNVIGGHLISAIIGVASWQWIPNLALAAPVGVGLAIGAMYFARCTHPPGGATALAAAIGSHKLHELGFYYVLEPILLNAVTILVVAIVFNAFFKWRRYPAYLHFKEKKLTPVAQEYEPIKHEDFVYALSHIDTFVDVTEEDLLKIYKLATKRHVDAS